jgi:hypothetical protein
MTGTRTIDRQQQPVQGDMLHVEHEGGSAGEVVNLPARVATPQPMVSPRPVLQHFSFNEIMQMAEVIARSNLFGSTDPNAVATLCMVAHAEGQHPALVFRDYNIIQGRPSKTAEAMQRDFLLSGGRIEWHYLGDDKGDATFSHPQGGSQRIVWDIERAKAAQLWDKKNRDGSPGMWKRYPRAMFRSRVVSEGVRTIWPAATSGFYETQEVIDIVSDDEPQNVRMRREPTPEELEERRKNAEDYVDRQIEAVRGCPDFESFDALRRGQNKEVRALSRRQPDLYARLMTAYEERENEFNGYDPLTGLKRDDEQPAEGEPMDTYSVFERRLDACRNPKEVGAVERDWNKVKADQDEETVALVTEMFGRRRRSFQQGRR